MKKIIVLSLFVFGCSGTTGYVPPEMNDAGILHHNIGEAPSKDLTKNLYGMPQPVITCGPECTGAGLYDSCTGLWADCVTSVKNCPLTLGVPLNCQNVSICYQPNAAGLPFVVECLATTPTGEFTWTDSSGSFDCTSGVKCPAGDTCTIKTPGVSLTGTCL